MKNHISSLFRVVIVTLAAFPAFALAAPTAGSAYYTDVTNSYVQDQTSQVMGQLNSILCFMGAMAPDQMVNSGDANGNYLALIDKNTCDSKGSGGQSNNTGAAYVSSVVNSTRASSTADMQVKAWLAFTEQGTTKEIKVYATASQAPSATLPYGVFRMDFCGDVNNCTLDQGFISATTSGLTFFSNGTYGTDSETTALQLNAANSTAGSGAISQNYNWSGNSGNNNFLFAYDANYFVRNDGTGAGDLCFDRNPANADESVWRYGLYDASGARISRNSGFPIEYTDTSVTPSVAANGYIGYYGMWTQGTGPASGATVNQVTYSSTGATKTPYTLLKTGGKLMKYTTANKTLADLNKVTFWYYAQNNIPVASPVMLANNQYELYWDNAALNFVVSGKQGTTGNMEPLAPTVVTNADMVTANPWGLWGWSQMMGGQFSIKGADFALLATNTSATPVLTQKQNVVYPSEFAVLGNLTCINDCPTAALIGSSNLVVPPVAQSTPFENPGWSTVPSANLVTYNPNGSTGNLIDPATSPVVSTVTTGWNANGIRSGRMVNAADLITLSQTKCTANLCASYNQGDVDLLPVGSSYYVWETGGQPWNQLALLKDQAGAPVVFEAPLQVNFIVPGNTDLVNQKPYGSYAGATISLQYGGFGDLWGIPNECIDVTTNTVCVFGATTTAQNNQRWTSKFTIPFDTTNGVVTAGGATYFAKPLDKEVRLAKVDCATTAGGLSTNGLSSAGLPTALNWIDPAATVGTKPTVTAAPQVIHGVKQY